MVNSPPINEKILLIVDSLQKEPLHVRLIAQKTGLNHVTVLNQLNALSEQGVVDFTTKGRNKEFSLTDNSMAKKFIEISKVFRSITK